MNLTKLRDLKSLSSNHFLPNLLVIFGIQTKVIIFFKSLSFNFVHLNRMPISNTNTKISKAKLRQKGNNKQGVF